MDYSVERFVSSVNGQYMSGDIDGALGCVVELASHVMVRDGATARVFSSPALDDLCLSLGGHLASPNPVSCDESTIVIVATSMAATGGHSRLIRQLLETDLAGQAYILLTATPPSGPMSALPAGLGRAIIEVAPSGNHAATLRWLHRRLVELSPTRTYLAIHGFDAVAVAALQPGIGGHVFFNHNNDHTLSLGVHLERVTHVDYHAKGFRRCCAARVPRQTYWPLTTACSPWVYTPPNDERALVSCCAGGFEKFELPHSAEVIPYSLSYDDMVVHVLGATGGRHLHIGPLSEGLLSRIRGRLDRAGIDQSAFCQVAFYPTLTEAFQQHGVDVYLGSMPRGGGLATVEAMSAGLPLVIHSNYRSQLLGDEEQAYPDAFFWRTFCELKERLRALTPSELARHGRLSRSFYQENHSLGSLRSAWQNTISGRVNLPPERHDVYQLDELQNFLDERRGYESFSSTFADRVAPWSRSVTEDNSKDETETEVSKSPAVAAEPALLRMLCRQYSRQRLNISAVVSAGQVLDPDQFVLTVLARADLLAHRVEFDVPFFVNFMERPVGQASRRSEKLDRASRESLYLADVLKAQGFLHDSLSLYMSVADGAKGSALRGLGDLVLTMSGWACEYEAYAVDGRALNPFPLLAMSRGDTWHEAKLPDAISYLHEARVAEPNNADGVWLLMAAYKASGEWQKAADLAAEYAALAPEAPDSAALRVRSLFPVDAIRAAELGDVLFSGWRDDLGRPWRSFTADIMASKCVPDARNRHVVLDGPVLLEVKAKVVQAGQVVEFNQPIPFEETYVARYATATVLPLFGMLLVNDRFLVADSLHHRRIHYEVFTASVAETTEDKALMFLPEPKEVAEAGLAYLGTNGNYYHWLMDELPRLRLLELAEGESKRNVIVDSGIKAWQIELLRRFGVSEDRLVRVDMAEPRSFKELYAPSHMSTLMVAHPEAVNYVRRKLLGTSSAREPKKGKRLYLTRKNVAGRSLMNAEEVEECFRRAGFVSVDPGVMSIDEQISLFCDAEVIAGPGGAALTNIVLAPVGAKLLNISSSDIMCQTFTSITAAIGQESWFCGGTSIARTYPRWIWTNFDFSVALSDVKLALECIC